MVQPGFKTAQSEYLELKKWLFETALPLWSSVGRDDVNGGFFEKIDRGGVAIEAARRTRVVCRQIYSFSAAKNMGWSGDAEGLVNHGWGFLRRHCFNADGTLITTVDAVSEAKKTSFDLYDHAFALLVEHEDRVGRQDQVIKGRAEIQEMLDRMHGERRPWRRVH